MRLYVPLLGYPYLARCRPVTLQPIHPQRPGISAFFSSPRSFTVTPASSIVLPIPPACMKLPPLRSLGELADARPMVVIAGREQEPLQFTRLLWRLGTLQSGDST